ncbi:hypothetical protein AXF42_Ash019285 [Apostasia shenzhenica]|uniref:Uncharacterized protein n=1 Tax=Apostasia shenzhenica TaxID=1088818 RepID=A0A2I0AR83_9ASPA|nr:hypothetical protein AXF42_Ash019285 [Apostasia shenzhenica]
MVARLLAFCSCRAEPSPRLASPSRASASRRSAPCTTSQSVCARLRPSRTPRSTTARLFHVSGPRGLLAHDQPVLLALSPLLTQHCRWGS